MNMLLKREISKTGLFPLKSFILYPAESLPVSPTELEHLFFLTFDLETFILAL